MGGQLSPPPALGATAVKWSKPIGVKMQPTSNGLPSGPFLPLKSLARGHWAAQASPCGVGWVSQVLFALTCFTRFSGIGSIAWIGSPVVRSRMYVQPVLHDSLTVLASVPFGSVTSASIVGLGQS